MLKLERRFVEEIVAHALEDNPDECCGFIVGSNGKAKRLYRMTNVSHSPHRFDIDGREMLAALKEMDARGWDMLAIYHSHTYSPAYPSLTDVRYATWPEAFYVLVSLMDKDLPDVRAFRILNGDVGEEALCVV